MHDTWAARDLPVLDATIALLEQSFMVTVTDIAARTDLAPSVVASALEALDPVYVDFRKTTTGGDPRYWYVFKVTPEARRAVGQWPTAEALASRLAEELAADARQETDAERQGLLLYAARLVGETLREATVRAAGHVLGPAFGGRPVPEFGTPVPEPEPLPEDDFPSLVELPELPELLRSRTSGGRTAAESEPDGADQPDEATEPEEPAEFDEPDESDEPEQPVAVQVDVPEAQQLEPLPEPDEFEWPDEADEPDEPDEPEEPSAGRVEVPEAQRPEPLAEPEGPAARWVDVPEAQRPEVRPEPGEFELPDEPDEPAEPEEPAAGRVDVPEAQRPEPQREPGEFEWPDAADEPEEPAEPPEPAAWPEVPEAQELEPDEPSSAHNAEPSPASPPPPPDPDDITEQ